MTGAGGLLATRLRVHVDATDALVREAVVAKLRDAGIASVHEHESDGAPGAVVVAAGGTVDDAIDACRPTIHSGDYRLLVVADVLSQNGVLRAVRAGARAMLRSAEATPERLVGAVHSAQQGEGRLPYGVLARLLSGSAQADAPRPGPGPSAARFAERPGEVLTVRQTEVLTLIAEGHGNAAIARALACSEHTVKNVIYELMARLQVRNRAHAVAHAVRAGLI